MRKHNSALLLIGLTYISFVSLGLPDGLLGVAWPSMRAFFKLPIDAGLNTYAATHFSARSVNWLHACYGIGATLGPIIMTGVLMAGLWQMGYIISGLAQFVLALCFGATYKLWSNNKSEVGLARDNSAIAEKPAGASPTAAATLRLPSAWLSLAIFFIYTGIEAAAGAWAYSLFTEGRAVPATTAGTWVSIYWGAFTGGRIISGFVIDLAPRRLFLRCCIIGMIGGALLLGMNVANWLSFSGLAIMGLSAAPIFPSLIASTPERLGERHTANGVGFQIAAAVLGQSLLPSLIGVLARNFGWAIVAPALLTAAILLLFLYEKLASARFQSDVSEVKLAF